MPPVVYYRTRLISAWPAHLTYTRGTPCCTHQRVYHAPLGTRCDRTTAGPLLLHSTALAPRCDRPLARSSEFAFQLAAMAHASALMSTRAQVQGASLVTMEWRELPRCTVL